MYVIVIFKFETAFTDLYYIYRLCGVSPYFEAVRFCRICYAYKLFHGFRQKI